MTLITLSASYGAGGSHVGPAVAERLGVPFLDRAIPRAVAEQLAVPMDAALARDEAVEPVLVRVLSQFGLAFGEMQAGGQPPMDERAFREATEEVLRRHADASVGAVILGRAGAIVLAGRRDALHVRLDGDRERRIAQAEQLLGLDHEAAVKAQQESDRARDAYVRQLYRVDPRDPGRYHLVIDSTRIPLDACVELIVAAAAARAAPLPAAG